MKKNKKKPPHGGARKNSGRVKKNNTLIYVRVPAEYATEARALLQEIKLQLEERRYQERIAAAKKQEA